jgi:Domain of unknown function (DUF5658)
MVRSPAALPAACLLLVVGLCGSAHAQDPLLPGDDPSEPAPQQSTTTVKVDRAAVMVVQEKEKRPPALIPLYGSFIALEALDVHSTRRGLANGAVEANPAMSGLTGNSAAMVAAKAAGTAGLILASEKIWKKNRTAAVVLMIATNSAMAWVVGHNYRAVR